MPISFSTTVKGAPQFRARLQAVDRIVGMALGAKVIQRYLLKATKDRFLPAGQARNAQKDSKGHSWARPHPETLKRKRRAGTTADPKRALYATGALMNSIKMLRKDTSLASLRRKVGGGFSIGISVGSPVHKYARVLHDGGYTPRGGSIPGRPWTGISAYDTNVVMGMVSLLIRKGIR